LFGTLSTAGFCFCSSSLTKRLKLRFELRRVQAPLPTMLAKMPGLSGLALATSWRVVDAALAVCRQRASRGRHEQQGQVGSVAVDRHVTESSSRRPSIRFHGGKTRAPTHRTRQRCPTNTSIGGTSAGKQWHTMCIEKKT
jgi:hypothetical protein